MLDRPTDQTGNYNMMESTPTIVTPETLRQIGDIAYETARAERKAEALTLVPYFNDLLIEATKLSMTHVENMIVIPGHMLEKICEPLTSYVETPGGTESVTKYNLEKLNMVGEALFRMIKDEGYSLDTFKYNELTVYSQ